MSTEFKTENIRDTVRKNFTKYTRKAFQTLPDIIKPSILDIGCGSGEGTLEVAQISNGDIIAIDVDVSSLSVFEEKIEKLGLTHQIQLKKCSIHEMTFSNNSFDIIWMEGLQFISFDTRLNLSFPLLKPGGFLVLHEGPEGTEIKIKNSHTYGFQLYAQFNLPNDAWWVEYYQPLEKKVMEQMKLHKADLKIMDSLNEIIKEIKFAKTHPEKIRSLFLIFQKI